MTLIVCPVAPDRHTHMAWCGCSEPRFGGSHGGFDWKRGGVVADQGTSGRQPLTSCRHRNKTRGRSRTTCCRFRATTCPLEVTEAVDTVLVDGKRTVWQMCTGR